MRIGDRRIGPDDPPYIIAEIGVNHDGSVGRALELTDAAADAGADAVKLQLFRTDLLMSRAAKLAAYQKAAGETDPLAMLRRLELSAAQMAPVVERAHARGIHAIVTVFSVGLVEEAERIPWDAYKTASPDIVHRPLLDALAATGRPLIVSTGASTLPEVGRALGWLRAARDRLAVLQCVSAYPTPRSDAALGGVQAIAEIFPGPVGYSDHTPQDDTSGAAVAFGAVVLEKHLTYDRAAPGPDHAASLDREGFRRYVHRAHEGWQRRAEARLMLMKMSAAEREQIRADAPRTMGLVEMVAAPMNARAFDQPVEKVVLPIERDVRHVSRQSITATRALPAGHRLTPDDLTFKRPGVGIEPWRIDEVIGRTLVRAVEADMPLADADLDGDRTG